jgi:hypothetical protein
MKRFPAIAIFCVLLMFLAFMGCAGTAPATPPPVQTSLPVAATVPAVSSPSQTAAPYPDALAMGEYATFGSGDLTGKVTVYRSFTTPEYNWTAPSFNSAREQAASTGPSGIQYGYAMEKSQEGNTFLFVFVRVAATGTKAVYAPSAGQFVVSIDGKAYNYSAVHSSDVTIDTVPGTEYDFQIGKGGEVGYVLPGDSNNADGYLIYEIPASFSPDKTFVVSNPDYKTQAVWKLG